ncbi:MAG: 5'-3' exonuclease H3TH domain-containing protein [Spongiibacteraceae bacterium]
MAPTVYLIDASIYIFRAYFSIPDEWHSSEGRSVNVLYGYTQFLLKFLQAARPEHLAIAYDESLGACFRNEIYPGYKASRALPDAELAFQLSACKQLTERMGIASLASERYEADDIIATLASTAQQQGLPLAVVSRDKDLGQLIKKKADYLWDFASNQRIYQQDFFAHFAVRPDQMVDYLALVGDSADDIPGVPGVGKKTAASLLQMFDSVENLYVNLDAVAVSKLRGAKGIAQKLADHREQVGMAQDLVRLEDKVPVGSFEQLRWQPPARLEIEAFLEQYGLAKAFNRQLTHCYWWQE